MIKIHNITINIYGMGQRYELYAEYLNMPLVLDRTEAELLAANLKILVEQYKGE